MATYHSVVFITSSREYFTFPYTPAFDTFKIGDGMKFANDERVWVVTKESTEMLKNQTCKILDCITFDDYRILRMKDPAGKTMKPYVTVHTLENLVP